MSITPLTFTGVSSFSNDFQTILSRAVSIAELPITALTNQQTDLLSEKTLAGNLSAAVATLATSVTALGDLGTTSGLTATPSDTSKITATVTGAASSGTYAITKISSLATASSETSTAGYSSTAAVPTSMTLTLGTKTYTITLGTTYADTLDGLKSAINASGADVTANIITVGTDSNYLSVSANKTGAAALKLVDNSTSTNFLTSANQGSDTNFYLNGVAVNRSTTSITDLIPGVTLNVVGTTLDTTGTDTGASISLKFGTDTSGLATALNSLVTNYNALATLVSAQTGSNAGLLVGNNMVYQTRQAMMKLTSYYASSSTSTIHSLSDLGISMSSAGQMSVDSTKLSGLTTTQVADAFSFLGSSTKGVGALASSLTQISDSVTGTITLQQNAWDTTDKRLTDQIATMTASVNAMQTALEAKLEKADSLLASLASTQSMLTSSIQSLNFTSYGYNSTAPTSSTGS